MKTLSKKTINVYAEKMSDGKWNCYTTFNSIDKSFIGNISVIAEMAEWIEWERNGQLDIIWIEK